jgi:tetratricopeptide (TPR) repeat protein
VGLMETKNVGDSVPRRRVLVDMLKIPPVFLGVGTLTDLEAFLQKYGVSQPQGSSSVSKASENEVSLYRDALAVHWTMYYAGTLQDIPTLQHWSRRIELAASEHSVSQQSLECFICGYYQLLATVYGDKLRFLEAFQYLDDAQEIAASQDNKPLQATIFYRQAMARLNQRKFALAKAPAEMAESLVHYADKSLQGEIYQTAGLTYALMAQDEQDKTKALKLLDEAGKIASNEDNLGVDVHHVRFNPGRYALTRADTLISLGRPNAALKLLDEADEQLPFDQRKRRGYMQILQGEAYLKKKELDTAISYLQSAFDVSSVIHSDYNIGYIARLCKKLSESGYGNSPALGTLKRSLWEYQAKQVSSI